MTANGWIIGLLLGIWSELLVIIVSLNALQKKL